MKRIFQTLLSLILLLGINNNAKADWVDDFFNSAVTTNAASFKTQKANYYSLGGFSARVPHRSESLMSISMPKINVGCGGIDTFWGGISFLNADYLVKKAEGVLKNAPYIIFSIGLKALSSQFGDTIEAVEALVDQLNQLNLDECAAAKGLVNLATGDTSGITAEWERLKTSTNKIVEGVSSDWKKIKTKVDDKPMEERNTELAKRADANALKFLSGEGYLLNVLAGDDLKRITLNQANAIRAIVGDIYFNHTGKKGGTTLNDSIVNLTEGCGTTMSIKDYMNSNTPYQTINNSACQYGSKSMYLRSFESLSKIKDALTSEDDRKKDIDETTVRFINNTDLPVFAYMASASIAGSDYLEGAVNALAPAVALGYTYASLRNLSANVSSIINVLIDDVENQPDYNKKMLQKLQEYDKKIRFRMDEFREEYINEVAKLNQVFNLIKQFEETNRNIYEIRKAVYLQNQRGR